MKRGLMVGEEDAMQHHELCEYDEAQLEGGHHVVCGGAFALFAALLVHQHRLRKRAAREPLYAVRSVEQ